MTLHNFGFFVPSYVILYEKVNWGWIVKLLMFLLGRIEFWLVLVGVPEYFVSLINGWHEPIINVIWPLFLFMLAVFLVEDMREFIKK